MRKPGWMITLCFCLMGWLAACGPIPASTPLAPQPTATPANLQPAPNASPTSESLSPLSPYQVPIYYDPAYLSIINASKQEDALYIYSSLEENSWNTLIRTFNSHYPWIEVNLVQVDAAEVFERYEQDLNAGQRAADLLISADPNGWYQFSFEDDLYYRSQEDTQVPDWSKSTLGTYTVFCEPMVLIYNQKLVQTPPQSMTELAAYAKNNPAAYQDQIVTYDVEKSSIGLAVNGFWVSTKKQAGWDLLQTIGRVKPRVFTSAETMIDLVAAGEAKIGYFVPLGAVLPRLGNHPDLGWTYLRDGQPILLPGMMITQRSLSPNSARLMLDFILSQEGQYTLALNGQVPYRSDITPAVSLHFDRLSTELGEPNLIRGALDDRLTNASLPINFIEKWKAALGQ